jgi:hypothetical protein
VTSENVSCIESPEGHEHEPLGQRHLDLRLLTQRGGEADPKGVVSSYSARGYSGIPVSGPIGSANMVLKGNTRKSVSQQAAFMKAARQKEFGSKTPCAKLFRKALPGMSRTAKS